MFAAHKCIADHCSASGPFCRAVYSSRNVYRILYNMDQHCIMIMIRIYNDDMRIFICMILYVIQYQTDPNREMCRSFCIYDILQFFTHLLYIVSRRVGFVFLRLCTGRVCTKLVYQALCFPFQYIKVARRQSQLHSLQQAASSNSGARHVPCRNSSADVGSGARHWNAGQDGSKFVNPNEKHIDKNCT